MSSTFSLLLHPGSLCPGVVVPVSVPSIGQIEILNHFLYLTGVKLNNQNYIPRTIYLCANE